MLGHSAHLVAVGLDDQVVAAASVSERLRETATEALTEFRRLGLPVEVLTGDTAGRAEAVGLTDVTAGLQPEDKLVRVQELLTRGHKPLVVGDGINDAPALAAAHAGVALASGTDLAVGSAAITLYHGDLRALPWAVMVSRRAVRVARRNILAAAGYNVIGMSLAAAGLLHPIAAVLLMVVSSLTMLFASLRVVAAPDHCDTPESAASDPDPGVGVAPVAGSIRLPALVHGSAITLQGLVFAGLVGWPTLLMLAATCAAAAVGLIAADFWYRRPELRHSIDMAFGMLTVGNLGMLLGWWLDNGLSPIAAGEGCLCTDPSRPWMWLGMLLFSNLAMLKLGRQSLPTGNHVAAMFSGGNLGMMAGMIGGGWLASFVPTISITATGAWHFLGMTAGMVAGMLLGTWLFELLLDAISGYLAGPRPLRLRWHQTTK